MSWFDSDPWHSEPLPPAPLGLPPQRTQQARPPAPLDQARPPAPLVKPPSSNQNIHHPKSELESVTRSGVHAEGMNPLCFQRLRGRSKGYHNQNLSLMQSIITTKQMVSFTDKQSLN